MSGLTPNNGNNHECHDMPKNHVAVTIHSSSDLIVIEGRTVFISEQVRFILRRGLINGVPIKTPVTVHGTNAGYVGHSQRQTFHLLDASVFPRSDD